MKQNIKKQEKSEGQKRDCKGAAEQSQEQLQLHHWLVSFSYSFYKGQSTKQWLRILKITCTKC